MSLMRLVSGLERAAGPGIWWFVVAVLLASAVDAGAAPTTARLLYLDGAEVRDAEIDVVRSLVESDLISHPDVLLLSERDPEAEQMTITGQLTRLGESYLLILTAEFPDGKRRSRRHKVASFDEIDLASERLVASLVEDVEVFDTVERGSVFEDEQEPESLVESDVGFELGFGTAWPISDALDDHGTMYGFHGAVVFDVRDFLVDLRTDFQFGDEDVDTFAFTSTVGGRYVWFDARRVAFYSGVDVGYGYVWAKQPGKDLDRSAFLVGVNSGVLLLRHADINLDLRGRIQLLTQSLDGDLPVLFGLSLGVRF
ncbi:MAG: hypothetical protein GY733_18690 [bacterium]|nr:hypothetical protein [bacterium]